MFFYECNILPEIIIKLIMYISSGEQLDLLKMSIISIFVSICCLHQGDKKANIVFYGKVPMKGNSLSDDGALMEYCLLPQQYVIPNRIKVSSSGCMLCAKETIL